MVSKVTSYKYFLVIFLFTMASNFAFGDPIDDVKKHMKMNASFSPDKAKQGEVVKLRISVDIDEGWHTYTATTKTPTQIVNTKMYYDKSDVFAPLFPIQEPPGVPHKTADIVNLELKGKFVWEQDILILPNAPTGKHTFTIQPKVQLCKDEFCLPSVKYPVSVSLLVEKSDAVVELSKEIQKRLDTKQPAPRVIDEETAQPGVDSTNQQSSLLGLLLTAFLGSLAMLLTPCVFPMIPVTVNFFLKQSEKEHFNPLMMSSVYSGTIVVLLTVVVLVFGNVVRLLAADPIFNLIMALILIYFGLSLFGMYEIELPSFLARFTSSQEGKGGYFGAVFMAMTFTITSFTCTGPFLGILLTPVANLRPPFWQLVLLALVYATTFAAPFFLLAMFPSWLKGLPKSGGWLNVVKVTMGFLEVAAAQKFISNSELRWTDAEPFIFTNSTMLALWVALGVACSLYLFGFFRLPHDDVAERIGVVRALFGTLILAISLSLVPAMFNIYPRGVIQANLLSLLPEPFTELKWHGDYEKGYEEAIKDNKLIFIDFTGVTCTTCRLNENNVFPNPAVQELLEKYSLVQLYTDEIPGRYHKKSKEDYDAEKQAELHYRWQEQLATPALPSYVILRPDATKPFTDDGLINGTVVGRIDGMLNTDSFIEFLRSHQ